MINLLVHGLPLLEGVDSWAGWWPGMAVLAEQGNSWGVSVLTLVPDSVMPPQCPAMALPSIDKVGHVRPYLLAAYRQLVVGDSHPMEQTGDHDHRVTPGTESHAVKVN